MTNQIEITTPRLILKSITPAIIHEIFNTKSDEEIMAYFGFDENGLEHHREMHEKGMETHRISLFVFLMINKETGLPIGDCGFHTWNKTHNRTEVFYLLRNESDKRKGYMTEALEAVLKFGFTELNLHRIEALIAAENEPSLRLLLRYGFTKEGTMREDYLVNGKNEDSECYSLLKWEWEKNQD
ncbi:GNAT family N-acetyltransferase [Flavobacterium sp. AS60]|uniref:GNAT family N-acetyltransferase n=1 Tax=Flavobacterium anseongense TaxID=2910677 RepID=UPI001F3061D1|nr:GNAT family protein [Flavobacterium sp. AS60]MCF6130538.1 GNAT family N-acetyltransferase [Flavobacterium sp. AS60]